MSTESDTPSDSYSEAVSSAYREGDLPALAGLMSEQQLFDFKYALVRQAIHNAEKILPPEEEDDGERGCIDVARRWLEQPTPEVAKNALIFAISEAVDGGLRYSDYGPAFVEPAEAAGTRPSATEVIWAARHARQAGRREDQDETLRWQLDAAWAILRGSEVPLLP